MYRRVWRILLGLTIGCIAFAFAMLDVAAKSIEFDLIKIGASIYEAHRKTGHWPAEIGDLAGTQYLMMPYRRELLEEGDFVIVWQQDLDLTPSANAKRVLAYDNRSIFARFGWVWACRGDLRIGRLDRDEVSALRARQP